MAQSTTQEMRDFWTDCFCMGLQVTELYGSSQMQSFCQRTILSYTSNQIINIATAFIIIIVNSMLRFLLEKLSNFVRYPSWSK